MLAGRQARPLGLAYWLVGEAGAEGGASRGGKQGWLDEPKHWPEVRDQLRALGR